MAIEDPIDRLVSNVVDAYHSGSTSEWLSLWIEDQRNDWNTLIGDTNDVPFYEVGLVPPSKAGIGKVYV